MALLPMTFAGYARALQVLHAVRTGWEPLLEGHFPGQQGRHVAWLVADMAVLRCVPLAAAPAPVVECRAAAWGVRYVLEGSALGGRMLLREAAAIGLSAAHGARYLAGEGADAGRHWADFLAELDRAADAQAASAIVMGARSGFRALLAFAQTVPRGC